MLEDRDYMRDQSGGIHWSMTAIVAVIMVVVFALQSINSAYLHTDAEYWLALTPACFLKGYVWQLITFQFLHAGLLHLGRISRGIDQAREDWLARRILQASCITHLYGGTLAGKIVRGWGNFLYLVSSENLRAGLRHQRRQNDQTHQGAIPVHR